MPLLTPYSDTPPEKGGKRRLAVIGAGVAVLVAGAGLWAAADPGSYERSGSGCLTVTFPSTTGGALIHECGARARELCRHAFGHGDRMSLLERPACRHAALGSRPARPAP
jgi:hypothetical protein